MEKTRLDLHIAILKVKTMAGMAATRFLAMLVEQVMTYAVVVLCHVEQSDTIENAK